MKTLLLMIMLCMLTASGASDGAIRSKTGKTRDEKREYVEQEFHRIAQDRVNHNVDLVVNAYAAHKIDSLEKVTQIVPTALK